MKIVSQWDAYLDEFPQEFKDIYFTEAYVKLYETSEDKAECFIFEEGNRKFIFPYLKKRIPSCQEPLYDFETPYGYGGPVCNMPEKSFCLKAFHAFVAHCRQANIIAGFIRFHPLQWAFEIKEKDFNVIFDRKTVAMDLTEDKETLWEKQLNLAHKRAIKKAEKSGLSFFVDETFQHYDTFIELYKLTMDKVKAKDFYYFNQGYFQGIKKMGQNVFIGFVKMADKVIAGALFFKYGMYGHYHLGGSIQEYLPFRPNNLLFYRTALYLQLSGIKLFHLGGGTDCHPANSLYRFKEGFSKKSFDFYIGKFLISKGKYQEICSAWEKKYPEKKTAYSQFFLKYRF